MIKKIAIVLLIIIIVGFGWIYLYPKKEKTPLIIENTEVIGKNEVQIINFSFSPQTITIKEGENVTWVNQDRSGHDIKFNDQTSPVFGFGQTYEKMFETKGEYDYSCGIHPNMVGKVIVE